MTRLRISVVEYLNTAPLIWGFTHGPQRNALSERYELSFTLPSNCAEALRTGAADVAILPAIEVQRIPDLVVLPDLAIASKHRVRSLLLVSKKPMEQAHSIALDRSSRSTQALTRILCAQHWKIAPDFVEMEPDLNAMLTQADAALLIGDPALRILLEIRPAESLAMRLEDLPHAAATDVFPVDGHKFGAPGERLYFYDVVEEWRRMTGLPAVLAVWAGRRETITPEVVADFLASREYGVNHLPEICADAALQMHLPEKELHLYLEKNIDYSLDQENLQGLRAFFQYSAALGLIDRLNSIQIAGAEQYANPKVAAR